MQFKKGDKVLVLPWKKGDIKHWIIEGSVAIVDHDDGWDVCIKGKNKDGVIISQGATRTSVKPIKESHIGEEVKKMAQSIVLRAGDKFWFKDLDESFGCGTLRSRINEGTVVYVITNQAWSSLERENLYDWTAYNEKGQEVLASCCGIYDSCVREIDASKAMTVEQLVKVSDEQVAALNPEVVALIEYGVIDPCTLKLKDSAAFIQWMFEENKPDFSTAILTKVVKLKADAAAKAKASQA